MLQILYLGIFCSCLTSCGLHSQGAALVSELRVTSAPVIPNGCKTLNPMESQIAAWKTFWHQGQKSLSCAQSSPPVVRGRGCPPKPKPAHPIVEAATQSEVVLGNKRANTVLGTQLVVLTERFEQSCCHFRRNAAKA